MFRGFVTTLRTPCFCRQLRLSNGTDLEVSKFYSMPEAEVVHKIVGLRLPIKINRRASPAGVTCINVALPGPMNARHLSSEELEAGLDAVRQSPRDEGRLEMIVIRPTTDERVVVDACEVSAERALHGDRWESGKRKPGTEITLMNTRAADLIAQSRERWPLAGDQLYVDFDLSEDHLPPGTRLAVGEVVFEIAAEDHTGCSKFAHRFGKDALKFVNSPEGLHLNLRGIYATVLQGGSVRVGDTVARLCR